MGDFIGFMTFSSDLEAQAVRQSIESLGGDLLATRAEMRRRLAPATDWAENDANPLSDGNQSLLDGNVPGSPGQALLAVWCQGWEINVLLSDAPALYQKLTLVPPFVLACAYGDAKAVQAMVAAKAGAELLTLVNSHYGVLRMTPLHFCAAGARHLDTPDFPAAARPTANHVAVAEVLLAAGALLEARDIAGFTPLAQATTATASLQSLSVAALLIKAGANVQPVDRLGRSPLVQFGNAMKRPKLEAASGVSAVVMLLLEAGADASFSAEKATLAADLIAAQKSLVRRYLESLGQPVTADRARKLMQMVESLASFSCKIPPTFLTSMAASANVEYCRANMAVINDCQARGRVGAGRTLEGEEVRLSGLKTAALNGLVIPVCGAFDPVAGRYAISIPGTGPGEAPPPRVVAVPARNVEAVGRRAAAGTTCGACGALDAQQVCGSCKSVRYCNIACQREHWRRSHKAVCSTTAKERTVVVLRQPHPSLVGQATVLRNATGARNVILWDQAALAGLAGRSDVVKVQPVIGNDAGDILVYNQERSFVFNIPAADPAHAVLLDKVKGAAKCGTTKAYFMADFRSAGEGVVEVAIATAALEPQPWT